MQSATEFLTMEECAAVDQALMTAQDKFATRVAIYALRSLKQIALQTGVAIAQLEQTQIEDWIYQDASLQGTIDTEFKKFFSNLVIASLKPLRQISQESGVALESLTIAAVVGWFERQAQAKMQRVES
ncbi:MAG: hypothetical protein KME16_18800 [Scytolyngbya sp. HA4215-MV1]|nr:hypothetical protein [Scytolyngbya sp. HA4215-MV1]